MHACVCVILKFGSQIVANTSHQTLYQTSETKQRKKKITVHSYFYIISKNAFKRENSNVSDFLPAHVELKKMHNSVCVTLRILCDLKKQVDEDKCL